MNIDSERREELLDLAAEYDDGSLYGVTSMSGDAIRELLGALEQAEADSFRQRAAMNREQHRAVRAEAQSETRRQQTAYWQERAEQFEVAEEQLLLRNRNLLDAHREAEARIQAVRDLHRRSTIYDHVDGCPDTSDAHADSYHEEDMDHRDEYYCTLSPVQDVCFECSDEDSGDIAAWPCPTIRALDAP